MKPRTNIQKEVHALMCDLPPLTEDQMDYAYHKMFTKHIYRTKQHSTCFECGHRWEKDNISDLAMAILDDVCPSCGEELKPLANRRMRTNAQEDYIGIITTVGRFQVFRYFYAKKYCKVQQKREYWIAEVCNQWVAPSGNIVTCSMLWNSFGGWHGGERWQWSSEIEVRHDHDKYYINPRHFFPNPKFLPIIRRNGYHRSFHGSQPAYFCQLLLSEPQFETLIKAKQYKIAGSYGYHRRHIKDYWPSIKIAIRHGYTVNNPSDWFDHLSMMEYLDMDIHNPKLICLPDFGTAHQRLVERHRREQARREKLKERKNIERAEKSYKRDKAHLLGIAIESGDLTVKPLASVAEFYEEGDALHHCVSTYHTRKDSLLMSARVKGERAETVEVSLSKFTVLQSRGLQNEHTKHHKRIVSVVESNMNQIKKASKTKKA
jgi:hypothetical protein